MGKIVVIGAGVTGLTTAYLLSEKGHDVTIVLKKFHFDGYDDALYTSNFAGANWASFASKQQVRLQNFDKPGYLKFMSLARREPNSGVHLQDNVTKVTKEYFQLNKAKFPDYDSYLPWYKDFVEDFRIIAGSELSSGTQQYEFAYSYLGVVISTNTYLSYLLNKCVKNGVVYKRKELSHVMEAASLHGSAKTSEEVDFVVNCSGVLSRFLGGVEDKNVYPLRGQTVLVENNYPCKTSVKYVEESSSIRGESFYLMPRVEGGCVIGGCSLPDVWDGKPDNEMAERIKLKALKFCPELVQPSYQGNPEYLKVVRVQVGLRPARKGDVRVERDLQFKKVIHNYGAGGTGFQSSYGTCGEVVRIIDGITGSKL